MKASNSSNSLMNLELDKECFICLDSAPNRFDEHVMHPFTLKQCGCRFTVHPRCWREWMRARNMCPICRRPIMKIRVPPPTAIVVEVEDTEIIQKNSILCMITCIVIVIVITLVFIFVK